MNSSLRYALDAVLAAALCCLAAGCGCGKSPEKLGEDGRVAFEARDFKKAAELFERAARETPDDIDTLVLLARAHFAAGELAAAREALGRAVAAGGAADADVLLLGGQIAFYMKDYASAAKSFKTVAENESLPNETRSAAWSDLGVMDMRRIDDWPADSTGRDVQCALARTELLRALRLDSRNASATYHLGRLYRDAYHYPELAVQQFEKFIHPMMQHQDDERVEKVKREYLPALKSEIAEKTAKDRERRDRSAAARELKRADALAAKKSWKDACAAYREALRHDPLSAEAAKKLARTMARSAATPDDRKRAYDAYIAACRLSPTDIGVLMESAEYAMKQRAYEVAAKLFSQAMAATSPNTRDFTAVDRLINALTNAGRGKVAAVYQMYRSSVSKK